MPKEVKDDDNSVGLRTSTRSRSAAAVATSVPESSSSFVDDQLKSKDTNKDTKSGNLAEKVDSDLGPKSSEEKEEQKEEKNNDDTKKASADSVDITATSNSKDTKGGDHEARKNSSDGYTSPSSAVTGGRASPSSLGVEVNMINMNNNIRPSSAASVHSNGSIGGPCSSPISRATTATSRRGGRTRSRSPPATAMGRCSPTSSPSPFPTGVGTAATTALTSTTNTANAGSEGKSGRSDSSSSPQASSTPQKLASQSSGRSTSDGLEVQPSPMSPVPANPSAAAAAAAAAAKSLHRSRHQPPPPTMWYGVDPHSSGPPGGSSSNGGGGQYGGPPPPHQFGGPSSMPGNGSRSSRYSGSNGGNSGGPGLTSPTHLRAAPASYYDSHHHAPSRPYYDSLPSSRGGGPQGERYSYRPGSSNSSGPGGDPYSYRSGSSGRPAYGGPPPPHHYDDYGRHPYGGPPPPPSSHQQPPGRPPSTASGRSTPHAPRPGSGMSVKDESVPSTPAKPTRRVIGTATPIHVPRAAEQQTSESKTSTKSKSSGRSSSSSQIQSSLIEARRGSAASVFRRSNSGSSDVPRTGSGRDMDDNPQQQKILMALESPSNSFEEKKSPELDTDVTLSPQDPPHFHRSPTNTQAGPPQQTNSLDMAPSFNLFNQSFDSLGDAGGFFNVGSTLESALQSTSFGGATSLDEKVLTDLQLTASGGTFKLAASSSGGALTFGMSPTNSFGNGPPSSRGGGNIFLLGGQDPRAASPSQVLDIYRTTSVSSPRGKMEDGVGTGNLRLSGSLLASPSLGNYSMRGSFGGDVPMMPQHQGYHPPPPHHFPMYHRSNPYHHRPRRSTAPAPDGAPGFYVFLRTHRCAFRDVTFLLPGLKTFVTKEHEQQHQKDEKNPTPRRKARDHSLHDGPTEHESIIAQRRVMSAICAFGGSFVGSRMADKTEDVVIGSTKNKCKTKVGAQSIFRNKQGEPATVTPQSSESSSDGTASRQQAKYDEALPGRYYENDNRLSWEFEENPPVGEGSKDDDYTSGRGIKRGGSKCGSHGGKTPNDANKKQKTEHDDQDDGSGDDGDDESKKSGDKGKMKYRCKLCGQPKTDHVCPYKQSLVRSIGAMVYPAVNAFSALEPGKLAPSLTEMNNFVGDIAGQSALQSAESSPTRPTPDRSRRGLVSVPSSSMAQVTPEALRSGTPRSSTASYSSAPTTPQHSSRGRLSNRSHGVVPGDGPADQTDLLFVEATDLNPEQFRMVTQSKTLTREDAFTYPALPLPYAQRKRLSDNLFSLSKEIPQLTDECASVLREARERDLWDLAVAELMTQVVIIVHCHDNDMVFEGLRRYMLSLGISC